MNLSSVLIQASEARSGPSSRDREETPHGGESHGEEERPGLSGCGDESRALSFRSSSLYLTSGPEDSMGGDVRPIGEISEEIESAHEGATREREELSPSEGAEAQKELSKGSSLFTAYHASSETVEIQHAVLTIELGEREAEACLDTGAGKNYIAAECLTKEELRAIRPPGNEGPVRHAGGGRMRIIGQIHQGVKIGAHAFGNVSFQVARGLPVSVILGNELITKHVTTIYPKSQWSRFEGGGLAKFRVKRTRLANPLVGEPVKVRSLERRSLPPETITLVAVELDQVLGVPALIRRNGKAFEEHGILPSQVVIPARVQKTNLLIGNFGSAKVDLLPRQCVAECEVDEVGALEAVGIMHQEDSVSADTGPRERQAPKETAEKLKKKTSHLPANQQGRLIAMLEKYADSVFGPTLGQTSIIKHEIATDRAGPVARPAYRQCRECEDFARTETERMLREGLVKFSRSPWAAPVIIAKKPKGGLRYCTDYRALNKITRKDSYPMPKADVLLDRLGGAHYFTSLDAERGFFQVEARERDQPKTAFSTPLGLLEYQVMPMGLLNSPATFQRLMDIVMRGLHKSAACYIDDIICFTRDFDEHLQELEKILQRLKNAGLTVNLSKRSFAVDAVEFLGHTASAEGMRPNLPKTMAIDNTAPPTDVAGVRRFLGLTGWFRKFIKDYAKRSRKLTELTKKDVLFEWSAERQAQFEGLKKALCSRPALKLPGFDKPFVLDTDASKLQIGGVLMQSDDPAGKNPQAVAYLSRTLRGAEINCTVTEKEALAAIWRLKKVRHIVGQQQVTVVTDHAALRHIMTSTRDPYGRLARWSLALQEYNLEFVTRAGKKRLAGDAMSRLPQEESAKLEGSRMNEEVIFTIMGAVEGEIEWGYGLPTLEEVKAAQQEDKDIKAIKDYLRRGRMPRDGRMKSFIRGREKEFVIGQDGLLRRVAAQGTRGWRQELVQVVAPRSMTKEIIQFYHSAPAHGHLGMERTYLRIRDRWHWIGMQVDIARQVSRCPDCIRSKTNAPNHPKIDLQSIVVERPGQIIAMDLLGGLPLSWGGKSHVLVISDLFTKYCRFASLAATDAISVADAFIKEWVLLFGPPEKLLTDRGVQFTSALFMELMKALEIKKIFTAAYHPQTDGQVERLSKTLINILRMNMGERQKGWEDARPMAEWAYNTSVHASTGQTSYFLTFKQSPPPFTSTEALTTAVSQLRERKGADEACAQWAESILRRFQSISEGARAKLEKARATQKKHYDYRVEPESFEVGELVYLFHPAIKKGRARKLTQPWKGPFKILERTSPQSVKVGPINPSASSQSWTTHINRLKKCPEGSAELYPLSEEGVEEQLEEGFDILKEIVKDKNAPEGALYRVVWQTLGDRTWEPEENLPPAAARDYRRAKAAKEAAKERKKKTRA